MWKKCTNSESPTLFHGKEGHLGTEAATCCTVISETEAKRSLALASLRGDSNFTLWGCYTEGYVCAFCQREAGESLWVTTDQPPRNLSELFPTTDDGQNPDTTETGQSAQPSPSGFKKLKKAEKQQRKTGRSSKNTFLPKL